MGTTADKLTYLSGTKDRLKTTINYAGAGLTNETFRQYPEKLYSKYLDILKDNGEELFTGLPKITGSNTSLSLNNTANTRMKLQLASSELEQRILPSEYQQVEYIESDGSQYLNVGKILSGTFKFEIEYIGTRKFGPSSSRYSKALFGCRGTSSSDRYVAFLGIGSGSLQLTKNTSTTITKLIYDNTSVSSQSSTYSYTNDTLNVSVSNLLDIYLFARNDNGTVTDAGSFKVYSFKMYDNNVLIRNLVPCYRINDNVIGMYDLVNNVFYTNAGTGTFAKGSNAPTPDSPVDIHTISGNNTINIVGKNLFDINNANWTLSSPLYPATYDATNDGWYNKQYMSLTFTPTVTQTISFTTKKRTLEPGEYNYSAYWNLKKDGNAVKYNTYGDITYTMEANHTYLLTVWNHTFINYIQIEYGSTATTYVSYQEQSLPLNLGELEVCKIGNYVDEFHLATESDTGLTAGKWYLKKNISKVILNETENWNYVSNVTYPFWYCTISSIMNNSSLYTNYLRQADIGGSTNNIGCMMTASYNMLRVRVPSDIASDLETFETWITNHNLIVYGTMSTPTYTLLNDTLQAQLTEIYKWALSYQDQTNISQVNNDLPFIISATAVKEYELNNE